MANARSSSKRSPRRYLVRAVTDDVIDDFVNLFEARGAPHYCWCTPHRFRNARDWTDAQKKAAMQNLVARGTPLGVLAYDGDEPIGWCSIAPRETYVKLQRSRSMPRVTPPETPTWTILCFFVKRSHRGKGVCRALLRGAITHARELGAEVVEAYPFDTAGISSTHRGHSSVFQAARFRQDGKRWVFWLGRA